MPENRSDSKFVKFYDENKFIMLSAAVTFLICQLIAFCYDLVPFGDMTVLRMDLYHQYGPMFAELCDRLRSDASLVYSWNSGLGSSFLGNFFNYLSSPLSFLVVLFGHKNITEAISFIMMLKAILSAVSFSYYLKKSNGTNSLILTGFGVMYAFCGFFVAYYWNIMWIDAMVLFPVIILGIETIINKGRPSLYLVCLSVMIFANYYMAYMICIFSFFYFFAYYFANYPLTKKFNPQLESRNVFMKLSNSLFISSGLKFALASVTAVLLAAVAIVPLITILSKSSATGGTAPASIVRYFTAFDFLANHLAGPEATIRSSGDDVLPNVYCGILTLILCALYLYSRKISIREKTANLLLLVLLYFSFNVNFLNYVWHGFHFPNDLPYRFSFMYSFILLSVAFKAFCNLKEFKSKDFLNIGIGIIFFVIIVEKITSKNVDDRVVIVSIAFTVAYAVALRLYNKLKPQSFAVCILLISLIISETALSTIPNYSMNQSKTNYTIDYDDFRDVKSQLDALENGGFYRMELTDLRTRMDPCWFNYNGVSVFSSMANESVANVQQKLGLYGNYINSFTYKPQTPVYNSLFALRYIADKSDEDMTNGYYEKVVANDTFTVYKNSYPLSVAFAASSDVLNYNAYDYSNPFIAQSELFRMLSGTDSVFDRLNADNITYSNINSFYSDEIEKGEFRYSKINDNQAGSVCFELTPDRTGNVYIYLNCKNAASAVVNYTMTSKSLSALDEPYVIDLGKVNAGDTIYIDIDVKSESNYGGLDFSAYMLNDENFKLGYGKLKSGDFIIEKHSDTRLSGKLTASEDGVVFTSIPFDKSWDVFIDGQKLSGDKIHCVSDSFLAFDIAQGEHSVTLNYASNGLIVGSFISIIALIVLAIVIIVTRRRKSDKWKLLTDCEPLEVTVEEPKRSRFMDRISGLLDEEYDDSGTLETVETPASDGAQDAQSESENK